MADSMLRMILISIALLLTGVAGMAVKIVLRKHGRFSSMHISDSKAMRQRGIGCVQSQDRAARRDNPTKINVKDL